MSENLTHNAVKRKTTFCSHVLVLQSNTHNVFEKRYLAQI